MRSMAIAITLAVTASLAAGMARAQDVGAGQRIAQTWCRNCHNVDDRQSRSSDAVPSFLSIAQMNSTTQTSLTVFLSSPHGKMPDFSAK